jgi:hypothetical protein
VGLKPSRGSIFASATIFKAALTAARLQEGGPPRETSSEMVPTLEVGSVRPRVRAILEAV